MKHNHYAPSGMNRIPLQGQKPRMPGDERPKDWKPPASLDDCKTLYDVFYYGIVIKK